ncbi:general secretion pathway protein C [Gammaproteobacteria bacterium]
MRIFLALFILALGSMVYLEWWSGEEQMARHLTIVETPPPKPPALPQPPDLALAPESQYAEIAQRTLFRSERRPAPPDESGSETAPETLDLKTVFLSAISLGKSGQFALWYDSSDHKTRRIKVGEKLKSYTVRAIRADALVLSGGGREEMLPLRDYRNRPPPSSPPPPPGRIPTPAKPPPPPPPPPHLPPGATTPR